MNKQDFINFINKLIRVRPLAHFEKNEKEVVMKFELRHFDVTYKVDRIFFDEHIKPKNPNL